jgi:hypothetical protein
MEFASTKRIGSLFHYCRFWPDRFEDVVANNRIWMSDTSNFNDPWDCRPCFDATQLGDPVYYERQVQWLYQAARRRTPNIPEVIHKARADQLRSDRSMLEAVIDQMSQIADEIRKRYRIFCLTTKPSNTLMWSHYAENHTGICLEFGCDNTVFSGAFKVSYAEAYPLFDLADGDDERVLSPLITKSRDWAYEDEYRLIAQERDAAVAPSLMTDENYLALPAGALRSIILGCSAKEETRRLIEAVISRHRSQVRLRIVQRLPNRYELSLPS